MSTRPALCTPPRQDSPTTEQSNIPVRPWRVLHACPHPLGQRTLIHAQAEVGMRPSTVTTAGLLNMFELLALEPDQNDAKLSLLNAWNDVRQWRHRLIEADAGGDCDLVHAHDFASGMAAVRNCPVVVYDITRFVEDTATPQKAADSHPWLERSFRVAEQFVMSRAAALVTRTESAKSAAIQRGALPEHTFVVPSPVTEPEELASQADARLRLGINSAGPIAYMQEWNASGSRPLHGCIDELISSFAAAAVESDLQFILQIDPALWPDVKEKCRALNIAEHVHFVVEPERHIALTAADIVIVGPSRSGSITPAVHPLAEDAMLRAKALLAADLPLNRDLTPDGSGCLWFTWPDFGDLTHRLTFLASNAQFRTALGETGSRYLLRTRSPEVIARSYDSVYRHAVSRRTSGGLQTPIIRWQPVHGCI